MASRKEYIDKLENQLREWNQKLDAYKVKAEGESNELKARFDKKVGELQAKRAELRKKLEKIKDSGEDTFDRIKVDADQLWDNLKEGFADIKKIVQR